jgi:hypothetical protein
MVRYPFFLLFSFLFFFFLFCVCAHIPFSGHTAVDRSHQAKRSEHSCPLPVAVTCGFHLRHILRRNGPLPFRSRKRLEAETDTTIQNAGSPWSSLSAALKLIELIKCIVTSSKSSIMKGTHFHPLRLALAADAL